MHWTPTGLTSRRTSNKSAILGMVKSLIIFLFFTQNTFIYIKFLSKDCSAAEILLHFCDFVIKFIKSKKVTSKWTATSSEIKEGCILHVQVSRETILLTCSFVLKRLIFNFVVLIVVLSYRWLTLWPSRRIGSCHELRSTKYTCHPT